MVRKEMDITSRLNPYEVIRNIELTEREKEHLRRKENILLCGELCSLAAEIAYISLTDGLGLEFNKNEFYGFILSGASIGVFLSYFNYWLGPKL